jgi:type II secretory pathway component PulF
MIESGIPIGEAIDIIQQQSRKQSLKLLLETILKDINNGQSLEKALSKHPKVFDPFYINIVRIGEESGNLEKNLKYLAEQLKKNYEFKKKVQGALMYPVIVLVITFIAGAAISIFVLPQLIDLFSSLDVELPLSTQILLFIAYTMKNYGFLIIALIIALFIGFRYLLTLPAILYRWHRLLLMLPGLGVFIQGAELTFLCRNLGMMLKSGLPITTAFFAQHDATTNLVFKKYLKQLAEDVEKGKSISEKLNGKEFVYIPQLVAKMIGVGEKTGRLDESLLYLGDFFADEVDNYSKDFSTLLEPVILIFIGLVVAFVALAVISPIYQLTSGIHR